MCGLRDIVSDLPADTVVIGASADKLADQKKFTDTNTLPFPLWSDTELKLIGALGVQMEGRPLPQRVTFVVDKEGVVRKVFKVTNIDKHPKEVLAAVKELAAKK